MGTRRPQDAAGIRTPGPARLTLRLLRVFPRRGRAGCRPYALCRQPAAPWVPAARQPSEKHGRTLDTRKHGQRKKALRERILLAGTGTVLQAVRTGKNLIGIIKVIKLLSREEAAFRLRVLPLDGIVLLDHDEQPAAGEEPEDLPEKLIVVDQPVLVLRLQDAPDLLVYALVVLRDQIDLVTVFPVLAEELHPCKTIFPVPAPGVEQVVIRTFI